MVFDRVKGAYAWDVDGNKYIDYVGTWGPAILGHADDDVLDAVKKTMDKGEFIKVKISRQCAFVEERKTLNVAMNSTCNVYKSINISNIFLHDCSRNLLWSPLPTRKRTRQSSH